MNRLWCVVLIGCVACGGGGSEFVDASPPPDSIPPDAVPIDMMVEPAELGQYVVTAMNVPTDATEAEAFGFDLDGDGTIDNQIGNIFSALLQVGGFQPQSATDAAIASGDLILLVTAVPCEDRCVSTFSGVADGDGFAVSPGTPTDGIVHGQTVGPLYTGGPGSLVLEMPFPEVPVVIELDEARVELALDGTGLAVPSKLGGAIPDAQVQSDLIPGMHTGIAAQIATDCTGVGDSCGCTDGSDGATFIGIFDENGDCAVPLDEFRSNSLTETLMRPDLDTDGDDVADALSVGVGLTAEAASFALP
jgi:hypothetical protein